jgi:hypothetical protein
MSRMQVIRWCLLALALAGASASRAQGLAPAAPSASSGRVPDLPPEPRPEPTAADRLAHMTDLARELTRSYLQIWSSNERAALADVEQVYGPIIVFYGQTFEQRHLAAEKRRFMRRWPMRSYALRPGTTQVQCSLGAQGCTVNAIVDWEVRAPARREISRGSSHFKLGIDLSGPQPTVSSEGGRVITRS